MGRVCADPGCPELTERTYCAQHKRERNKAMKRSRAGEWASRQYKTARWQKRRAAQLARYPYCQCPVHDGHRVPATIADHVEPHRGDPRKFWRGKLQSLTKACHDGWKARLENSGVDSGCDERGYPSMNAVPATIDTGLVQSGIAPKWPAPGAWIHYNQSPPMISEGRKQRQADQDEMIVVAVLNYKWRQLTHDYRLRLPLDIDQFSAVASACQQIQPSLEDFPFKFATCNGHCNRGFLPHGTKMIVDFSAEAVSGDIVMVDFDEETEAMFTYFGEKHAPQYYEETYGHVRGADSLKVYVEIEGREIFMNAGEALLKTAGTRISGVIRNVQIDGKPVFGSLLKIETREIHNISPYQPEVTP